MFCNNFGRPSILFIRAPGLVSCLVVTRLLTCGLLPSCVRDVVVGVGLALALHPPVVCLAILDSFCGGPCPSNLRLHTVCVLIAVRSTVRPAILLLDPNGLAVFSS